ncbi:MAG: polysaccharide deacetylase [Omnitrophica WOR_2 bacterium SM23_72]|nr:MAG: polysaccharide deacetylase [Omnitrophica WOR_2 bacterium SM23_72]
MINGLSFDIEDWFQVENLRQVCPYETWEKQEIRVEKNTERLLELLQKFNQKATFFILGWIAEKKPELVKKIAALGHEIASHGYKHELVYTLTPKEFEEDLLKSKKMLEDLTGQLVIGYRAPSFSITEKSLWAIDILSQNGFKYDSSIFPTSLHDRYGLKMSSTYTFTFENGLTEFTLSTFRLGGINLPIAGGGYFRLLPYGMLKKFLKKFNEEGCHFIFYLHPWEIDGKQPRVNIKYSYRFRHYINLDKTYAKLERLLSEFRFSPLNALLTGKPYNE